MALQGCLATPSSDRTEPVELEIKKNVNRFDDDACFIGAVSLTIAVLTEELSRLGRRDRGP